MKRILWVFAPLFGLFADVLSAQPQMFQRLSYPVEINGSNLKYPFAGGFNAPQFSEADLNHDGIQDLVVFDRSGNSLQTFLNHGTANTVDYTYAPEFACYFPEMIDYVVMRDFNKDGAADIFTSSIAQGRQEIQAYKGYYDGNVLKFTPYQFSQPGCALCDPLYVYYPDEDQPGNWNNLPINPGDIPAFDDINGDGDIDIVTFEAAAGGYVWLLENQSVELGLGLDVMRFRLVTQCWGGFYESGMDECYCDLGTSVGCCYPCLAGAADERNLHPGSTLLTYDQDGDGDKEIVLGDVSFSCLNYLENGGNNNSAWMTSQQSNFPAYDVPAHLNVFPAAFYVDLDNDGKKDLIASPNNPTIGEDQKNVWFYKNTGTNNVQHFELQQKDLFTKDMIDIGTVAHPALADVNGDGLIDLVVGNYGYFTPGVAVNARLFLFLNTGTPTQPQFKLTDSDWLGMSEFTTGDYDFAPAFGDIDGDGALDVVVGSNIGGFYCYRNQAGPDEPMNLTRDFDIMWVQMDVVGSVSTPVIYDLDQDGLVDIIAGERTGYINYFKNNGSSNEPLFPATPTIGKVGQIDTRTPIDAAGYAAPTIVQTQDGPILVTGAQSGQLEAYFIGQDLSATFTATDLKWGNVDAGHRSHPALADLDSDGILEMVVGNYRGGLDVYRTVLQDCSTGVQTPDPLAPTLKISPNPSANWAKLEWPGKSGQWRSFNALGQLVDTGDLGGGISYINVQSWPSGIYMIEVVSGNLREVGKLVRK